MPVFSAALVRTHQSGAKKTGNWQSLDGFLIAYSPAPSCLAKETVLKISIYQTVRIAGCPPRANRHAFCITNYTDDPASA